MIPRRHVSNPASSYAEEVKLLISGNILIKPEALISYRPSVSVEENAYTIPTNPVICYNANNFVSEVYREKTSYRRWNPHPIPGVFHDTRSHPGRVGLDNIRGSLAIWRIHDL